MLLFVIVSSALAANPYLDEGAALFDRMLYEKAVPKLKRATEVSASTVAERRRSHDLLARTYVALGQNELASRTFVALLSNDARAPAPEDASPTIRRIFLDAKEQLYPKGRALLRRVPAPAPRITVELVDPWEQVARVELRQETHEGSLDAVPLEPAPLINAEVLPAATSCSIVALNAGGDTLATIGPLQLESASVASAAPPTSVVLVEASPPPKWP